MLGESQTSILPDLEERRKILAHAGTVLAQARSLLDFLDSSGPRQIDLHHYEGPAQIAGSTAAPWVMPEAPGLEHRFSGVGGLSNRSLGARPRF